MQIDWFTVLAQLFNFLVLVWLLKRFLYRPILDAIDAREKRIAANLSAAAAAQQQASSEREKYQTALATLEAQREQLLNEATQAAQHEQQRLLAQAHSAADELGKKRRHDQERQLQTLRETLQQLTLSEVFALTRKVLSELATTSLEHSMVTVFSEKLQQLPEPAKSTLQTALTDSPAGGTISSSLPLDGQQQQRLQDSINTWANATVPLHFAIKDTLICGIELSAKGQQLAWHIAMNLELLEAALTAELAAAPADTPRESASA